MIDCDVMFDYIVDFVVVGGLLVSVDFENGFGDVFGMVVEMIWLVVEVGVVGGLIEDVIGCVDMLIYVCDVLVECIVVVVDVVCVLLFLFMLIVCCENYLYGCCDFDDMIVWFVVYCDVGVDVLYVFGIIDVDEIVVVMWVVGVLVNVVMGL